MGALREYYRFLIPLFLIVFVSYFYEYYQKTSYPEDSNDPKIRCEFSGYYWSGMGQYRDSSIFLCMDFRGKIVPIPSKIRKD